MRRSTVRIDGLRLRLRTAQEDVVASAREAVFAAGDLVRADAQNSIVQGSISGPAHVPSRPGEPPNADTRQLDTGIRVELTEAATVISSRVVSTAPYSAALEYGTLQVAPRPFMRPALARNQDAVYQIMIRRARERQSQGGRRKR